MSTALNGAVAKQDPGREYVLTDKQFSLIATLVRSEAGINLTEAAASAADARFRRLHRVCWVGERQ